MSLEFLPDENSLVAGELLWFMISSIAIILRAKEKLAVRAPEDGVSALANVATMIAHRRTIKSTGARYDQVRRNRRGKGNRRHRKRGE